MSAETTQPDHRPRAAEQDPEWIRLRRIRAQLTQEELADRAGVDARTIRDLERGRTAAPRASTVRLLTDALAAAERQLIEARQGARGEQSGLAPPRGLPPDTWGFVGRTQYLAKLNQVLDLAARAPTAVVISAIAGTAGVGKTTLAIHWAHRVAHQFPDGQLYVNLRGFDPAGQVMDPAQAVRGFLHALDVPPQRIPADFDAQVALYRSTLVGRQMLIMLDNARDAAQVRPLLPGTAGCLVIVTSRNQLTGLISAGAHPLMVDLLTAAEAQQLLCHRLGIDRVASESAAVEEIIVRCAQLPLALAVVAARAATHPNLPLQAIASELRETHDRLDTLVGDDPYTDVRTVFSWSYHALSSDAARLFRLLGLHPGPDVTSAAAASLAALPLSEARPLMGELARTNLLVEHAPGRYIVHDLLRAYATDLTHRLDTDAQRHASTHQMLDHYLHTAYAADRLIYPRRDPITLTPIHPGVTPENHGDHEHAMAWFTAEHHVLLAIIERAASTGFDTATWQLAWTLWTFLHRRGHWHDQSFAQRLALTASKRLRSPTEQAHAHRNLASADTWLGRFDDAHQHLQQALDLFDQGDDVAGKAHTHASFGILWVHQGRYTEALDHDKQALDLYRVVDHRTGLANALNQVGWDLALLGEYQRALIYCQQALSLQEQLSSSEGQAATLDSLGYIHHHLGHNTRAIICYEQAIGIYRDVGDRYQEADILTRLGDTHHAIGNQQAARHTWRQALAIFTDLNHSNAENVRVKLAT